MTLLTNRIAELRQILAAAFHIPIFALAVQRRGTKHNMIVHMLLVGVCRNDVGKLIVGQPGRQLFSDLVCFLRRDLSRLEGLPDMIDQNFIFDFPSGIVDILLTVQHEFIDRRFRHAGVR